MPEIHVFIRSQFGNKRIFPADAAALHFATIAGTHTLTTQAIDAIKALGYRVVVDPLPDAPPSEL